MFKPPVKMPNIPGLTKGPISVQPIITLVEKMKKHPEIEQALLIAMAKFKERNGL